MRESWRVSVVFSLRGREGRGHVRISSPQVFLNPLQKLCGEIAGRGAISARDRHDPRDRRGSLVITMKNLSQWIFLPFSSIYRFLSLTLNLGQPLMSQVILALPELVLISANNASKEHEYLRSMSTCRQAMSDAKADKLTKEEKFNGHSSILHCSNKSQ